VSLFSPAQRSAELHLRRRPAALAPGSPGATCPCVMPNARVALSPPSPSSARDGRNRASSSRSRPVHDRPAGMSRRDGTRVLVSPPSSRPRQPARGTSPPPPPPARSGSRGQHVPPYATRAAVPPPSPSRHAREQRSASAALPCSVSRGRFRSCAPPPPPWGR